MDIKMFNFVLTILRVLVAERKLSRGAIIALFALLTNWASAMAEALPRCVLSIFSELISGRQTSLVGFCRVS
jgi:hypothetical protein